MTNGRRTVIPKELDEIKTPDRSDPNFYTTASGVKLKLKRVSSFIVMDAGAKIKDPPVPKYLDPEKGREEENPLDPQYKKAMVEADRQRADLAVSVYLGFGTEVVSEGTVVCPLDSQEWIDELLELTDLDIPVSGRRRYLAWLKYHVLDDSESNRILQAIQRLSGIVQEREVLDQVDSFRSDESGDTPESVPSTEAT